jgi:ubiquitin-activating enzyme E1
VIITIYTKSEKNTNTSMNTNVACGSGSGSGSGEEGAAVGGSMEVDESLYSRQLYVMGHEAQRRMAKSNVLIVGMNGLGVETAKNVILAGVKSVTLHDDGLATMNDLASQFYITEDDLGQPRAQISAPRLAELNPYVPVSVLTGDIQLETLKQFTVVVLIEIPLAEQLLIADYCHNEGIALIASDVRGVFSTIFCDFGETFVVSDVDGEPAASSMIATITVIDDDAGGGMLVYHVLLHTIHTILSAHFNSHLLLHLLSLQF